MINNLIFRTILDDLKDQNDPITVNWKNILLENETLEQKKNISFTEPKEIREEMRNFYQNILSKQTVLEEPSAIEKILNSDDDQRPLLEFKKKDP